MIGLGILIIPRWTSGPSPGAGRYSLIIIALGTLIRRVRDFGGWIIGCVGLIFLSGSFEVKIYAIATFFPSS